MQSSNNNLNTAAAASLAYNNTSIDDISQSYGLSASGVGGNPYRMPGGLIMGNNGVQQENRSLSSNNRGNGKATRKVPYGVSNTLLVMTLSAF